MLTVKKVKLTSKTKKRSGTKCRIEDSSLSRHCVDKSVLKNALKYLQCGRRSDRKNAKIWQCHTVQRSKGNRTDNQVKLRCRQLPNVVMELRKAILRQKWNEAASLLMILCHPALKLYSSIIIKTCFLLLFTHPKSNIDLLQNFIRATTGYILDEDIYLFIKILFVLRNTTLEALGSIKVMKNNYFKVTKDPEFDIIK